MKQETKHTPAPWGVKFFIDDPVNKGREHLIKIGGYYGQMEPTEKEMAANVRLIAAAPELLEALETLRDQTLHDGGVWQGYAENAINKAKGINQ